MNVTTADIDSLINRIVAADSAELRCVLALELAFKAELRGIDSAFDRMLAELQPKEAA